MGQNERRAGIIPKKAEIAGSVALVVSTIAAWGCSGSDAKKAENRPPEYIDDVGQLPSPSVVSQLTPIATESFKPIATESFKPSPSETPASTQQKESKEPIVNIGDWQFRLESWEEPNRPGTTIVNGVRNKPVVVNGVIFNESDKSMDVTRIKNESASDLFLDLVGKNGEVLDRSGTSLRQDILAAGGVSRAYFYKDFYLPPHFGVPIILNYEVKPEVSDYKLSIHALKPDKNGNLGSAYINKGESTVVSSYIDDEVVVKTLMQPVIYNDVFIYCKGVTTQKGVNGLVERLHFSVSNRSSLRLDSVQGDARLLVFLKDKKVIYGDLAEFFDNFDGKDIILPNQTIDLPFMIGYERYDKSTENVPGLANKIYEAGGATVLLMIGPNLWGAWKLPEV